jgi:membrane glycosyltransferase
MAITLASLFLPKLMGVLLVVFSRSRRRLFGGFFGMLGSVLLETIFSTLLAPVMMLFQTLFVTAPLIGRSVSWDAQPRDDRGLTWKEAFIRHAGQSLIGLVWGIATFAVAPDFFWWLTPIFAGLVVAVPLSVLSSRLGLGLALKRFGLFLTPEETNPPPELRRLRRALSRGGWTPPGAPGREPELPLVPAEAGLPMAQMAWPAEKQRNPLPGLQPAN